MGRCGNCRGITGCASCLFQSTTCRTAGFNTVDIGRLTNATLFMMILLMFVGAGPCSTGGGCKVSTVGMLVLRGWATFRGQRQVSVGRRTVPESVTDRAEVDHACCIPPWRSRA